MSFPKGILLTAVVVILTGCENAYNAVGYAIPTTASVEISSVDLAHSTDGSSEEVNQRQIDFSATRAFAGHSEYPPPNFKGYGIIAFPGSSDDSRAKMFCRAYLDSLEPSKKLERIGVKKEAQMVTVWPIDDIVVGQVKGTKSEICTWATENYDKVQSLDAIADARRASQREIGYSPLQGRGPYLLAWSPGGTKGKSGSLVLVSNLSQVNSQAQANAELSRWRDEIETKPELWENGWSLENVRITIQRWVDQRGQSLLSLIGVEE